MLVVDIGGGSTELILGDGARPRRAAQSLDVGSVRLTERQLPADPPTGGEVAAAVADVDEALDALPAYGAAPTRGHAGRGRRHRHHAGGLRARPADLRPRAWSTTPCSRPTTCSASSGLLAMTVAEREALPCMHPAGPT